MLEEIETPREKKVNRFWLKNHHWRTRTNGVNSKLEDALFGDIDPTVFAKKETPLKRRMAELCMKGFTTKQIADLVERSPATVSNALRQPAARTRMINLMRNEVQDELRAFLDQEVMPSLEVIRDIRDDPNNKAEVRQSAAVHLLDRRLGRPTQPIAEVEKPVDQLSSKEMEEEVRKLLASERENGETPQEVPGRTATA